MKKVELWAPVRALKSSETSDVVLPLLIYYPVMTDVVVVILFCLEQKKIAGFLFGQLMTKVFPDKFHPRAGG